MSVVLVLLAVLGCCPVGSGIRSAIPTIPNLRFVADPSDAYVGEGGILSLDCRAECNCSHTIRYSWSRGERNITADLAISPSDNGGRLVITDYSGVEHAGVYTCFADVDGITIRSRESVVRTARLTFVEVTAVRQQVPPGGISVLRCQSDSVPVSDARHITWHQDGRLIESEPDITVLGTGELVLRKVSSASQGTFTCEVKNQFAGRTLRSQGLQVAVTTDVPVDESPVFLLEPANQTAVLKQSVAVFCIASGSPLADLELVKVHDTGQHAQLAVGKGIITHSFGAIAMGDDGRYLCMASSRGKKKQKEWWLSVLVPPTFTQDTKDRLVRPQGGETTLRCSAVGIPPPRIEWYFAGKRIKSISSESSGKLRIPGTKLSDTGIYQCFARNAVGEAHHSLLFFVRSKGLPLRAPQNVSALALSPSTIEVSWGPPKLDNNYTIVAYSVSWKENQTTKERSTVVGAKEFRVTIDRLFGGTVYEVFVTIYSSKKTGEASKTIFVKTPEGVPRIGPSNVEIRNCGNGKLMVKWSGIAREFSNGHIVQYTVFYGRVGGKDKHELDVPASQLATVISGLRQGDLYTIEVAAKTKKGSGPTSKIVSIKVADPNKTDLDKPAIHWKWINKTAVNVTWNLPISSMQVTGYQLLYINTDSQDYFDDVKIHNFSVSVHSFVISELDRKNLYRVALSVLSNGVKGRAAVAVLDGIPRRPVPPLVPSKMDLSEPTDLQCETKDATSIFLSWNKPVISRSLNDFTAYAGRHHKSETMQVQTEGRENLFRSLQPGTWYYFRVTSNKKKLKGVTAFSSKYIACKTLETKPGPPLNLSFKMSYERSKVILLWYGPVDPNGLVTSYTIRYRMTSSEHWSEKIVRLDTMNRALRIPSIRTDLKISRSHGYEVEVSAVNEAGSGNAAKLKIPKTKERPQVQDKDKTPSSEPGTSLVENETTLGIIIGCAIAAIFIFILVVVFILKNPLKLKAAERRLPPSNGQGSQATYLYLQRMQDNGVGNGTANGHYTQTFLPSADQRTGNGFMPTDNPFGNPDSASLNGRRAHQSHTADVTGSSSGPPICTCVCFQHGRNCHRPSENDRVSKVSRATSTRDDELPDDGSTASEERESAESADSRTQMLPARRKEKPNSEQDCKGKGTTASSVVAAKDYVTLVQETAFHV